MDIYAQDNEEGMIDFAKAKTELASISGITHEPTRNRNGRELNSAILLDIAASLRLIARESSLAMMSDLMTETVPAFEGEVNERREVGGLDVGDVVALRADETHSVFGEIVVITFSEGEYAAEVDTYDGGRQRVWLKDLERLHGDEGDEPDPLGGVSIGEAEAPETVQSEPDLEDVVEDIDADFDGDSHTAAESALDVLAANEAARKAGKKKGSKK